MSDAKCGAKHMIKDAAACTKECVLKGSDCALVVGDKVYTLKTSSEKDKMELGKLDGKMGDVTGDNVMVKSVAMGMAKKQEEFIVGAGTVSGCGREVVRQPRARIRLSLIDVLTSNDLNW